VGGDKKGAGIRIEGCSMGNLWDPALNDLSFAVKIRWYLTPIKQKSKSNKEQTA